MRSRRSLIATVSASLLLGAGLALVTGTPAQAAGGAAGRAYVANLLSDTVSVIDTATETVTATIPVASSPQGLAVDPAGNFVYAIAAGRIAVIDAATNTVVDNLAAGTAPRALAFNPSGTRVYVSNDESNDV